MIQRITLFFWTLLLITPVLCCAELRPEEILLVANRNVQEGTALVERYRLLRGVPVTNLLSVDMPREESCSRREYDDLLLVPLKKLLAMPEFRKIRCLLLFYGMPLRIRAEEGRQEPPLPHHERLPAETSAAVDSELVLAISGNYRLAGWQPNPFFASQGKGRAAAGALLVSRLDASRPETVKRMMADSIIAEQEGLYGRAYFDARWPANHAEQNAYQQFDATLHAAAALTQQISKLPVVLNTGEELLSQAPDAALYCGWYRLADYQEVFTWLPGAVGYHVASGECTSLKNTENNGWCKGILEAGGAATLGPVAEPYLAAFPQPDLFFSYLLNGYYTLVESYFFSLPYVSWQMILIGDPLYRPFRNH